MNKFSLKSSIFIAKIVFPSYSPPGEAKSSQSSSKTPLKGVGVSKTIKSTELELSKGPNFPSGFVKVKFMG